MLALIPLIVATAPPPPAAPPPCSDLSESGISWSSHPAEGDINSQGGLCALLNANPDLKCIDYDVSGYPSPYVLCCRCGGGSQHPAAPPLPPASPPRPPYSPGARAEQDPHLALFDGGVADFRGKNDTWYVLHSSPGLHVAARTSDTTFLLPSPTRMIFGSFFTGFAMTLRDDAKKVYGVDADASAVGFEMRNAVGEVVADIDTMWRSWSKANMRVSLKQETVAVVAQGWSINVTRKPIFNYLSGPSRFRYDFAFAPTSRVVCYPHGLIGQSYDGDGYAINGRRDKYDTGASVIRTAAMAEGAIEGSAEDYELFTPHARDRFAFRHSRFDRVATEHCAPRDTTQLQKRSAALSAPPLATTALT